MSTAYLVTRFMLALIATVGAVCLMLEYFDCLTK